MLPTTILAAVALPGIAAAFDSSLIQKRQDCESTGCSECCSYDSPLNCYQYVTGPEAGEYYCATHPDGQLVGTFDFTSSASGLVYSTSSYYPNYYSSSSAAYYPYSSSSSYPAGGGYYSSSSAVDYGEYGTTSSPYAAGPTGGSSYTAGSAPAESSGPAEQATGNAGAANEANGLWQVILGVAGMVFWF